MQTTLITGASRGLGRFLAEHYLAQGHRVVGCSRSASDLGHEHYHHYELDVAEEAACRALFSDLRRKDWRISSLVNNAGIASMNHSLLTPLSTVEKVLRTNVGGTFLFSREAAKQMRGLGGGRIVNFTTVAVPLSLEGEAAYVASKAAVEALTRVLAREFAEFKITVNAVGPVPIETDLIRAVPAEKIQALVQRQPIKRLGEKRDVANVVDFFLAPGSDFITGQVVYLGGL